MTRQTLGEALWSIDDLELELRKLPGVRAAGFEELDDMLLVQLHVSESAEVINRSDRSDQPVTVSASRIAARHSDRPVAIEVVRWRVAPPTTRELEAATPLGTTPGTTPDTTDTTEVAPEPSRPRLLAVLAFPDTDELEVHLVSGGKRTIGRAAVSQGIEGTVAATIDALRDLGTDVNPRVKWAHALDEVGDDDQVVVAVALEDVDDSSWSQYGMASGTSLIDAAARATLDALNRRLGRAR
jgi:hypothetical protein